MKTTPTALTQAFAAADKIDTRPLYLPLRSDAEVKTLVAQQSNTRPSTAGKWTAEDQAALMANHYTPERIQSERLRRKPQPLSLVK